MAVTPQGFIDYLVSHSEDIITSAVILIVGIIFIRLIMALLHNWFDKVDYDPTLEIFIQRSIRVALYSVLIILVLDNAGVNVNALIAGLGIAGFIIGFATKDIFSNIAAGLFLLVYKPFKLGDIVIISDVQGTVIEISLSACMLESQNKEWILVPNTKIWGSPIRNLSRLKK